jgi:hypothetical protein
VIRTLGIVLLLAGGTACTSTNATSPSEAGASDTGTGDGTGGDARIPTTCASPGDCVYGVLPVCCVANACILHPPNDCTDANVQLIQASNYDQSCKTDSDCVAVAEGNGCYPGAFNCPYTAISMGAYAQYKSDIAKTQAALCYVASGCALLFGPCCIGGTCRYGSPCASPLPTGDAAADATEAGDAGDAGAE